MDTSDELDNNNHTINISVCEQPIADIPESKAEEVLKNAEKGKGKDVQSSR